MAVTRRTELEDRFHRAVSPDGTEIVGRVHGQGPPVVFVHGAMDDGELCWGALLPFLTDRFTCYVPSTRGRGLSDDHAEHTFEHLIQDVTAFVDSIGEPVGLVGTSSGGTISLGVAARTSAVSAVAVYEPTVLEGIDEETLGQFGEVVGRVAEAAAQDRPTDAARTYLEFVSNDEELEVLSESGGIELAARYLPVDLQEAEEEAAQSTGPSATAPSVLERITVPVLVLHGSKSALPWITDCVGHVAEHASDVELSELAGAGHLAPIAQPERVAEELTGFFEARAGLSRNT
jgi:pimeloyl-ACP methyl ester carboxylesterase